MAAKNTLGASVTADPNPNIYGYQAATKINLLLSWLDREPFSKTYGCCDRSYWAWKFTDFPGARFQEAVYAFAHLYCFSTNSRFKKNPIMLRWISGALAWWKKIQHSDGSFDEAYPYERSLAATAFTTFYVCEGLALVADQLNEDTLAPAMETLTRAADWLSVNDEHHGTLSNHLAAAAAALENAFQLTGEKKFRERSRYFIQRILSKQSDEGWYEEYGGFDPGYQTHSIFYLSRTWQWTSDSALFDSLERAVRFQAYFVHPDRTLGGEYSSRNTEFYMPAGFEILSENIPIAGAIAAFLRPAIESETTTALSTMDAYNFLPFLNNYMFAERFSRELPSGCEDILPCFSMGKHYFPDAGVLIDINKDFHTIIGLSKGGSVKVFDTAGRILGVDCGYWTHLSNGKTFSSQSFSGFPLWTDNGNTLQVEVPFVQINQKIMTPLLFLGFRIFSLSLGRLPAMARKIKSLLAKVLIHRRREIGLRLIRRITISVEGVHIEDRVENKTIFRLDFVTRGVKFATIHMGSSRYFQPQELEVPDHADETIPIDLMPGQSVILSRSIPRARESSVIENTGDS